ncbi:hypothetical protein ACIBF5_30040 [Micromonospora sp. NPDC050417]|uniref:hypothetical protein n=1 Tax=Micromonospora sp. NPDC050417 TaxID=3364280 RepID=UPI0037B08981
MSDDSEDRYGQCANSAPYLLGALTPDAVHAFEQHLIYCANCQDACDDLGPAASALGGLSEDDVRELLDERVADDGDRRDPLTGPPPPAAGPGSRGPGARQPVGVSPSGNERPPTRSIVSGRPPISGSGEKQPHPCILVRSWVRLGPRRLRVAVALGMLALLNVCATVGDQHGRGETSLLASQAAMVTYTQASRDPARLAERLGGPGLREVERALSVTADSLVCVAVTGTEGAVTVMAWMDHAVASAETPTAGCV